MAADLIAYCLEHVTDYGSFERLCNNLMFAQGYRNIEPLGGMHDAGRDALHIGVCEHSEATVFSYTVRKGWRRKVNEDARKIRRNGHVCNKFVLVCTARFSSEERDRAVADVKREFGWTLELY